MRKKFIIGESFGRLTIVSRFRDYDKKSTLYKCKCECGNETTVYGRNLRRGVTKPCGCYMREFSRDLHTKHGMESRKIYTIWCNMKKRCYDKKCPGYKDYGGRGIKVYDKWIKSFQDFYDYIGDPPEGCSLDRYPNNDGNYEPGNIRWATRYQQRRNSRHILLIKFNGETKILKDWCDDLGLDYARVGYRIRRGWTVEKTFSDSRCSL